MHIRLIYESQMPPQLDAALIELLCIDNPDERENFNIHGRGWNGTNPLYCTIVEHNHHPIAYVGVIGRTIRVGTRQLRIAGPQDIFVHPNHRGQALSIKALALAMNEAKKLNFNVGLLFCPPNLQRLYTKIGWHLLTNTPITYTPNNHDQPLPEHSTAMFLPLQTKTFPPGPIHLQGDDW